MNPTSARVRRFTVVGTPHYGHNLKPTPGIYPGDVVTVTAGMAPDADGDYLVRKESNGRTGFIREYNLRELRDAPTPTPVAKVAVKAVERAAKALGMDEISVKALVATAKAIEAGI